METTAQIRAAKKFGPGYFIREQMELREWTQEDLAEVMGITLKHLNKILQENQPLTLETARILSEVFNSSAQYWLNIDTGYRLWLEHEKSDKEKEADLKSVIYERMPVRDMIKKGWLNQCNKTDDLKSQILDFWNWDKLDFKQVDDNLLPCLTKKSSAYNQFNASYAITWYQMARKVSETLPRSAYIKENLEKLYNEIHLYTIKNNGIELFLNELYQCGVVFFVLPHLQKTYLDGAAFISGENPAIIYTGRYKRIDNFWFTVAHEIAHVLMHLGEQTPFILDNLKNGERNELEDEANDLAAAKLMHREISEFLYPYLNYLTTSRVEECAKKYNVHPSIIIGKLAFDEKLSYRNIYLYNEDVLKIIPEKYQKA
ncbi:MAG: ImmA/IrrE family metallo-endopeptidase [Bacteroidales bacterium]|nr:ImmA/IrrE family metallo-endopeptidase [Bacteroidales bacterium]